MLCHGLHALGAYPVVRPAWSGGFGPGSLVFYPVSSTSRFRQVLLIRAGPADAVSLLWVHMATESCKIKFYKNYFIIMNERGTGEG